ncbi:MAG: UDP-N-acetylenolpyruvoylglucosamine reductase [Bacteroidetes bacterium]|nr:UDP-N-acetylenolpyruvoylglucosamine reductase [Bacteroidota bacterium]|tara:strand:+ start:2244 stop:3263 length:1020 start_codon:yes stop_codon:yes gene_type:complete
MVIKQDFSLIQYNTFGLDVVAHRLAVISSIDELQLLYDNGEFNNNNKILILSKGSNILFSGNVTGLVLLNEIIGKEVVAENEESIFLRISSGESWPDLVDFTIKNGWGGLENMTDIPGMVGAAPIQNIGAYGAELQDVLISLETFDLLTGKVIEFTNSDCNFGYRSSIFKTTHKNRYFITSVLINLSKKPKISLNYKPLEEAFAGKLLNEITIKDVSRKISEIRNSKLPDPDKINNAGSFFKNPIIDQEVLDEIKSNYPTIPSYPADHGQYKLSAAWLIEQCGWKGKRKGNVGVYEKQALVIINFGDATGSEILDFANSIQKSVIDKFSVSLELEVNVV